MDMVMALVLYLPQHILIFGIFMPSSPSGGSSPQHLGEGLGGTAPCERGRVNL